MVEDFVYQHSSSASLYCCGACGIREYETTQLRYHRVTLEDLPECFCYDSEEMRRYNNLMSQPRIEVRLENGETYTMEPWKAVSCFQDVQANKFYHLHPELVDVAESGSTTTTMFCMRCWKSLQKGEASKFSIAGGVDFGFFGSIEGLEDLNLHEELMLAKFRLYQCVIKVMPNGGWNQKQYTVQVRRQKAQYSTLHHTSVRGK
jgi:hypothetical protein